MRPIYSDADIVIWPDRVEKVGGKSVAISSIVSVEIRSRKVGDYKAGAVLFLLAGLVITPFTAFGIVFLLLAAGAIMTDRKAYFLFVNDWEVKQGNSRSSLKSIGQTIMGLAFCKPTPTRFHPKLFA